ncbi:diphthamide synthesis protein [Candidatus Woesearchaeota archaeon]|nr:diphthamide synthesis protein [Candidatus Woesearchaeota archaeon]
MKTLFLEAHVSMDITLSEEQLNQLPKEIGLFTTVQFIDSLQPLVKQLEKHGIAVKLLRGKHTQRDGQILGCEYLDYPAPAFLYIGDGQFHPQAIAIKNNKAIYCYNPYSKEMKLFDRTDIEKIVKQHKAAILKFLSADTIGVIISTKPGQQFLKRSIELKERCEAKGKKVYLMISNTVDFTQMNNFPFVECWVNSACPRIGIDDKNKVDKPMVNLEDVYELI